MRDKMKRTTIQSLVADSRIFIECPECAEAFPLKRAGLFYADEPIPPKAKVWIQEQDVILKEGFMAISSKRSRLKDRSQKATESAGLGRIVEKIVPSFRGFPFDPQDCRALFEPID